MHNTCDYLFFIFTIFGIDILYYTLIIFKCKTVGGFEKKNILVWFNLTWNQTSSKIHHGLITSYTFIEGTISHTIVFVIELFMRMTKSQVKFIRMKNVLLKISKVPIGTIGTLDDWKVTFNVSDPYTFWDELHYDSKF